MPIVGYGGWTNRIAIRLSDCSKSMARPFGSFRPNRAEGRNAVTEVERTILQFAIPGSILVLAFVLKLVVDRRATLPDFIFALLELPVDVAFLATWFVGGAVLSRHSNMPECLIAFVCYVIGSIIVVTLWRRSSYSFENDKQLLSFMLGSVSYLICVSGLVYAVSIISGKAQ